MTSRRELYAHGEPFGDSATRRSINGKGYVCGFGGDSSSSSSNTTNNYDKRVAVQDGFGLSGDKNTVSMTTTNNLTTVTTDSGVVKSAFDFSGDTVERAFDSIDSNNATLGEGYGALIDAAENIFNRGENLIGQTQKAVADAYGQAQADKNGTIDNRTIIVLAAVGAVALFAFRKK